MPLRLRSIDRSFARFCRTGDPAALAQVFDATAPELLRIAAWLTGDRTEAEDLLQRTFLIAIEQRARFDEQRRVTPWLVTILTHQANNLRRARARRTRLAEDRAAAGPDRASHDPADTAACNEFRELVDDARRRIGAPYAEVLDLHLGEGLDARHIAARLGRPAGTVRTQIVRALRLLRERLSGSSLAIAAAPLLFEPTIRAAVRRRVLQAARDVPLATPASAATAATVLPAMWISKKTFALVPVVLLLMWIALDPPWGPPTEAPEPTTNGPRATAATSTPIDATAPNEVQRVPVDSGQASRAPRAAETQTISDVHVRLVWVPSRRPAAALPVSFGAGGPTDFLAHSRTDERGDVHFSLAPADVPAGAAWIHTIGRSHPIEPAARDGLPTVVELPESTRVRGRVVDDNDVPVADAAVMLVHDQLCGATVLTRSSADGTFSLAGLPDDFRLQACAGPRRSDARDIGAIDARGMLELRLQHTGDALRVHVVDRDGTAVSEASVRVNSFRRAIDRFQRFGSTGTTGEVRFDGLPAATYGIEVVHRSQPPAWHEVELAGIGVDEVVQVVLGASSTLNGRVLRGGQPAGVVQVQVGQADALVQRFASTDEAGRFTVPDLGVGRYELWLEGPGFSVWRIVELIEGPQELDFDVPVGARIAGTLWLPDGEPAADWSVAAQPTDEMGPSLRTVSDARGRFAFTDLGRSSYRLVATGPNGGGHTFYGPRANGEPGDYRLPPDAIWRPASIRGRFVAVPPNATLRYAHGNDSMRGVQLDVNGIFGLADLQPGPWRLALELDDQTRWLQQVELRSGQSLDLGGLTLPPCGSVAVTVRGGDASIDARSFGLRLVPVDAPDAHSDGPRLQPRPGGEWVCERVPQGRWWLLGRGRGFAPVLREVFVRESSTQRIDVELTPAVEVVVRLLAGDATGRDVGWRLLRVRRSSDDATVLQFRGAGSLTPRIELGPGSYTISIESDGGFRGSAAFEVARDGGAASVDVVLSR